MNKRVKQILLLLFLTLLLSLPYFVFAETSTAPTTGVIGKMQSAAQSSYQIVNQNSLMTYIGQFIAVFLGLLGIIFVALMIYAGFKWMTAAGDADDVKKAKATIRMAIIGLVITIAAYALWKFVADYLL